MPCLRVELEQHIQAARIVVSVTVLGDVRSDHHTVRQVRTNKLSVLEGQVLSDLSPVTDHNEDLA